MKAFVCINCHREVKLSGGGTQNRNHCKYCLWSKHVDTSPGDRIASCGGKMKPVGLTFKKEGLDKYGKPKQGELMLVHQCNTCGKLSINRIAGDDDPEVISFVFEESLSRSDIADFFAAQGIVLLEEKDRDEVKTQLFGKKS